MVTKIALLYAVAPSHYGNFGCNVFELAQPMGKYILVIRSDVVLDLVHSLFSSFDELLSIRKFIQ
jgi:hypothetical protein